MQIWVNPQSGTQISDTRDAKTKLPEEYLNIQLPHIQEFNKE